MINLTTQQKLLLATQPIDFRCGIDALVSLCKRKLELDAFSGIIFAFTNRSKTAVKLLAYDGNGFWLIMKRFSCEKLAWWPDSNENLLQVQAIALKVLLEQGDPRFMRTPLPWKNHNEALYNLKIIFINSGIEIFTLTHKIKIVNTLRSDFENIL